ncbi:hypothetical protein SAMN04488034_102615 [Salinimicrobium catena]|uniref:Uncharacterized protein n=1 Tax=Salinimicrobium catena TaxID=390640 RepID=A0A1H5M8W2_9FLAO|nr:hypothetical protein [Salinimicrobium catena]SDL20226.1 hypothetical protein SAMN04488140_102615 [Salinimicrobium catena]SEE85755.1 hypothetical protein SAMN04488034_102615 [Salinimicrobium catena]
MSKKAILRTLVILVLLYPVYMLFKAGNALDLQDVQQARNSVLNYQVSIWISWVLLSVVSIYYKWSEKRNFFFYFTYGFLLVSCSVFGYFHQSLVNAYDLPSPFEDSYTLGVVVTLQNLVVSFVLTALLQAAVWWFTRRWHRR